MTDRLIRITTALAVVAVAVVTAVISSQHAYKLVRSHGESGVTARLLPFTVDGLIWAASMVVLDASRRGQPVPRLAAWSLGTGMVATVGANLAHGPVGALVSAWPALALVGSFELSPGVLSPSCDVAPDPFAKSFCNTSPSVWLLVVAAALTLAVTKQVASCNTCGVTTRS